jgi:DNA-binding MarR family transcriptional regulator
LSENSQEDKVDLLRLWVVMLRCTRLIENEIRKDLRKSFDTTLPRFDVMAQLERNPQGLRMSEISEKLLVTNGNITGIIDGLAQEGLVERTSASNDRRATVVRLTAAGNASFTNMASQHREWIETLFDDLNPAKSNQLFETLDTLLDRLHQKTGQPQ